MTTKFDYCLQHIKVAAEEEPKKGKFPLKQVGKIVGGGLAGLGIGHMVGFLGGHAAPKLLGVDKLQLAKKIAPLAGAALGVAYPMWKAREQKEIADAIESSRNPTK